MILTFSFFLLFCILEGIFISFPLVFLFLIFFALRNRNSLVFVLSFIGGILLDIFYLRQIGLTSVFFLVYIFALLLYERKFEIGSYFFVFLSVALGSFIYFSLFENSFVIQKSLITVVVALIASKFLLKPRILREKLW